jgi:archaellum component FlaC
VEDQLLGMRPKSATLERSLADIILDQQPLEMISIEIEALAEQVSLIAEELLPVTSKLEEILSERLVNNR